MFVLISDPGWPRLSQRKITCSDISDLLVLDCASIWVKLLIILVHDICYIYWWQCIDITAVIHGPQIRPILHMVIAKYIEHPLVALCPCGKHAIFSPGSHTIDTQPLPAIYPLGAATGGGSQRVWSQPPASPQPQFLHTSGVTVHPNITIHSLQKANFCLGYQLTITGNWWLITGVVLLTPVKRVIKEK